MNTENLWKTYNEELYFFILKRVKNKEATYDIIQNTFLKIHKNLSSLKNEEKVRSWIYQIARNELIDYFKEESKYVVEDKEIKKGPEDRYQDICCFDKFIDDLPEIYKNVVELTYLKGLKQKDVAKELDISLENVKIRIKRGKDILKTNFNECCKYDFDNNGKLIGEANCAKCNAVGVE